MYVCCRISTRFVLSGVFVLDREFGAAEYEVLVENNGRVSVTGSVWPIRMYRDASCKVSEHPKSVSYGYSRDYLVSPSRGSECP